MDQVPSIFYLSSIAIIITAVGMFVANKLVKPIDLEAHGNFLNAMLSIVGTLVSIILGLLVADALNHYQTLEQNIDLESNNVSQIYRMSVGLPAPMAKRVRELCNEYCNEVMNEEWPLMAERKFSTKVLITYIKLLEEVARFRPANDGESNLHAAIITSVQQVGDMRRQRLLSLHSSWLHHLMPMLILCSCIVLSFAYLYARKGATLHAVLICFVAIALVGNIGLVFLLNNPFSGEWKIQPRGFELNRSLMELVKSDPEIKKLIEPQ